MQERVLPWCLLGLLGPEQWDSHWILTIFFFHEWINELNQAFLLMEGSRRQTWKASSHRSMLSQVMWLIQALVFHFSKHIYKHMCVCLHANEQKNPWAILRRGEKKAGKNQSLHWWSRGPPSPSSSVHPVFRVEWEQSDEMPSNPGSAEPSIRKCGVGAGRVMVVMEDLASTTSRISISLLVY